MALLHSHTRRHMINIHSFILDSTTPLVSIFEISSLLAGFCGCAGQFESYLVENPDKRFSHDMARIVSDGQ